MTHSEKRIPETPRPVSHFRVESGEDRMSVTDCSDLLVDFLRRISQLEREYFRTMAGL